MSVRRYYTFLAQKSVRKLLFFAFLCSVSDDSFTQCSVDTSGNHWACSLGQSNFTCSVDDSGCGIVCVDKQHCPYAEESQRIRITVHVRTEGFLVESYSARFFLSEIGETFLGPEHIFSAHNTVFSFICPLCCSSRLCVDLALVFCFPP